MPKPFWSQMVSQDENDVVSQPERVAVKRSHADEDIHELAIDIYEKEDKVLVVVPLAGVKATDIDIIVDGDSICIKGMRNNPFEELSPYLYSTECYWGQFERRFALPSYTDTRDLSATFRNGILLLEASRIAPGGARKIHIR